MIGTFAVPYFVPKWFETRVTLLTSSLLIGFATVLIGPFWTEKSLEGMIIGLACSGFILSFMIVPNISEMMQAIKEEMPSYAG